MIQIVVAAFALYLVVSSITAISVQRSANSLASTSLSDSLAGGEVGLNELDNKLQEFRRRLNTLRALLLPARKAAWIVGVVPPVENQRLASELLLERAEIDYIAAIESLELGRAIFTLQNEYISGSNSISDTSGSTGLSESLMSLGYQSTEVLEILSTLSPLKDEFEGLEISGPLSGIESRMSSQEARLEQLADFSRLLSKVLLADLELISDTRATFEAAKLFLDGEITIYEVDSRVSEMVDRTHEIRELTVKMAAMAPPELSGTEYGDLVSSITNTNIAIDDLFTGIKLVLGAAVDSFDSLGTESESLFSDGNAISGTLMMLVDREEELAESALLMNGGIQQLRTIDTGGLFSLGEFGDVLDDERIRLLIEMSAFLQRVPRLTAEVLGVDGEERKYFVLGQTSDELRAAGGFTSSAWLMKFQSGAVTDNEYLEVGTFEDPDLLNAYPEAFEELQLHMDAGRLYLRDVGWNPNFPSAGVLAADFYEIRNSLRVDGVLSITQWALIDLASAIGGLEIDSELVSGDDLLLAMEDGTDAEGARYLASLFNSFMASVTGSNLRDNFVELLTTIVFLFESKDLMIYSEDQAVQGLVSGLGWDGALPNPSQDRIVIIDSNVGWNKVDRNIDRRFNYEVDLSDVSAPTSRLNLSYVNNSSVRGRDCETQSHVPNLYDVLLNGCYWNYIRVYVPGGAQLVDGDDLPLAAGSIASAVGKLSAGRPTVQQLFDENGDYVSGLLTLAPQTSSDVALNFKLPGQIVETDGNYIDYSLDLVAQAGTRGRMGTVTVVLPVGYEVEEIEPVNGQLLDGSVIFDVLLDHDESINLRLRRSS
jgi:hypothetical protein